MRYDYIVWDFNGTILDDLDLCLNILNVMLEKRNLKIVTKEEYREIFTFPVENYYKAVGFDFDKEPFSVLSVEFIDLYQKASLNCPYCPYIEETLKEIKRRGINQILLSASQKENLKEQVDHLGIGIYFDHIYGISNIYAKSKVDLAHNLRNRVGNDAKILFIGDSIHDAEVADSINADCILIDKGHQSKNRLQATNKLVVDNAREILKVLD